jgi:malate dehydrogenase (oxaloacetate-decarboxylating)
MRNTMIRDGLPPDEAIRRFWAVDRHGLLTDDRGAEQYDFQRPYARPAGELAGDSGLAEVVAHVKPTILIGTSTQAGAFTEAIVRQMAAVVDRPIILPLSNPTAKAEALPADLIRWTDGRALVATGSPFSPVRHQQVTYRIAQANNALVFPGLGLGVTVARARRVTDGMITAASDAVAALADATAPGSPLLPPVADLRLISAKVAIAVAEAAAADGVAEVPLTEPVQQVYEAMWRPLYPVFEAI